MKVKWRLSFILIVFVLTWLTFWNYKNRIFDWDLPGYIGCFYTFEFPNSPEKVHNLTFTSIKEEAPAEQYSDIIGVKPRDKARQAFEKSTQAFIEQLPYFKIKVGYNLTIYLLYKVGFSPPMSVLSVSLFSYFFAGLLLFYILKIFFPENYLLGIFLTIGVMLLPPMTYMSRVSTPDMFILQFLLVFIIGVIKSWSKWIMFLILFLITFIRPDYVPFTLTYLMMFGLFNYFKTKDIDYSIAIQGGILFILYFSIIKLCNYPGWKDLFFDTFMHRRPLISAQPAIVTLKDYFEILYIKIIYFKRVTVISVSLLCLTFYLSKDHWVRSCAVFIFLNIYIKFLFFPHSSGLRFFFGFMLLLFIVFLCALSKKYNGFKLNKIA